MDCERVYRKAGRREIQAGPSGRIALPLLAISGNRLKWTANISAKTFLQPHLQAEMGKTGYDDGARILTKFFKKEVEKFNTLELHPLGKEIINYS
jgi:hypothetical protein